MCVLIVACRIANLLFSLTNKKKKKRQQILGTSKTTRSKKKTLLPVHVPLILIELFRFDICIYYMNSLGGFLWSVFFSIRSNRAKNIYWQFYDFIDLKFCLIVSFSFFVKRKIIFFFVLGNFCLWFQVSFNVFFSLPPKIKLPNII